MAHMIPTDGGHFDKSSKEKEMFDALSKLSNDYYVFHSYRLVQLIPDKGLNENEIDFLIFNPYYGCLFLECKNRTLRKNNEKWEFLCNENGNEIWKAMEVDPFTQAFTGQHNLFNKLKELYRDDKSLLSIIKKCKFMVGIWLPKYSREQIDKDEIGLGSSVAKETILTRDELKDSEKLSEKIQELMERMNRIHLVCYYKEEVMDTPGYNHKADYNESMKFFKEVLTPTFRAIVNIKKEYEDTYIELLDEQYVVLDYLIHQRTAAISGSSGTGKTLVAVERARRISNSGQKVLFLCYNRNLADWLNNTYKKEMENVDFYTLAAFGCKKCQTNLDKLSYYDLKQIIENEMLDGKFEYKHIIIDEGQDFGRNEIDETNILDLLFDYGSGVLDEKDTSFFIFYDKNQLVNSKKLPQYLQDVDSKLTLYKNCRNTVNIANTAYSLIGVEPNVFEHSWVGEVPSFIFYREKNELINRLNNLINELSKDSNSERVIITCANSIQQSDLYEYLSNEETIGYYVYKTDNKKTKLYTCPTFKGLESDVVIITDITNDTFDPSDKSFYVSASRAKKKLFIFIDQNKVNLSEIINNRFSDSYPFKDETKRLATAMHGFVK